MNKSPKKILYSLTISGKKQANIEKVLKEIQEFIGLFFGHVIPVLWVTPEFLKDDNLRSSVLYSGIKWKCIKVHPQLSPDEWEPNSTNYESVVSLARSMKVPVLIHTGVVKNCHPSQIAPLFNKYKDQLFIMAHGRPIEETFLVMESYRNTIVDTAFMPIEHIQQLVQRGYEHRILWGSDYPIIKFYERNLDYCKFYREQLVLLREMVNSDTFERITCSNFSKIFNFFSYIFTNENTPPFIR